MEPQNFSVYDQGQVVTDKPLSINRNCLGMFKLKVFETKFQPIHFQSLSMSGFLNINVRKTDLLAVGALKFDLQKHKKIDYTINKLMETVIAGTVIYC